jgi:hypothetical protein
MNIKVTPEIKDKIVSMHQKGKTASEMSKVLNINANTIHYHIDKLNGKEKSSKPKNKVNKPAKKPTATANTQKVTQKASAVVGYIHEVPVRFDIAFFSSIKEIIISKHGFQLALKDGTTRSFGE